MRSHGVFTIGPTARDAVKAAVMCEDAARTVLWPAPSAARSPRSRKNRSTRCTAGTQNEYGQR